MKPIIYGKVFVLGDDIDTDQIIPAQYLVYSLSNPDERKFYGKFALSGVPREKSGLPTGNVSFVEEGQFTSQYNVIVAGKNFGCGSSREHAPEALAIAGVDCVIAPSFARIFYRNSVDGGFLVPLESVEKFVQSFSTGDHVRVDLENNLIMNQTTGESFPLKSPGDITSIIDAGGIFEYARKKNMIGG
ncbi:MAG: 3-isopropylmalate dehydratase small subunit [Calditrichia bacterium]